MTPLLSEVGCLSSSDYGAASQFQVGRGLWLFNLEGRVALLSQGSDSLRNRGMHLLSSRECSYMDQ